MCTFGNYRTSNGSAVQTENVWRSNTINRSMFGDHTIPVWTPCLVVFDRVWQHLRDDKHLVKHCKTFCSFGQWSNIFDIVWPFNITSTSVWSQNNVWSRLVSKHFPFGQDLELAYLPSRRRLNFWGTNYQAIVPRQQKQ